MNIQKIEKKIDTIIFQSIKNNSSDKQKNDTILSIDSMKVLFDTEQIKPFFYALKASIENLFWDLYNEKEIECNVFCSMNKECIEIKFYLNNPQNEYNTYIYFENI